MQIVKQTVIQKLADALEVIRFQEKRGTPEKAESARRVLKDIERNFLPSGSGFDSGTSVSVDTCRDDCIQLFTTFRHMNDIGYYDGWTAHPVYIRATFGGISITVGGRNRNGIKEYILDVLQDLLNREYTATAIGSESAA